MVAKTVANLLTRFDVIVAGAALVASVYCGCSRPDDRGVLARVGEREITAGELDRERARRNEAKRPAGSDAELLAELVDAELLLQGARMAGLEQDEGVMRSYRNLLIGHFKERALKPKLDAAAVGDEAIAERYERELGRYQIPERRRLALIFIGFEGVGSEESRKRARARAEEARSVAVAEGGDGFSAAAARFSNDQASRYRGGDVGWVNAGGRHARVPDEVLEVAFAADFSEAGEASGVIETDEGCYLVRVTAREEARAVPLEQVGEAIRRELLAERRIEIEAAFRDGLKAEIGVEVFEERLGPGGGEAVDEPVPPEL